MPNKSEINNNNFTELRRQAEALLASGERDLQQIPTVDIRTLIHELDTYRIELELQNEELRHSQQALEESRKMFSDLYDFAPVAYLTISETGLISAANLTAAKMLGVPRGELLHQRLSAFIATKDQDHYYLQRKNTLSTKERQRGKFLMQKKGGAPFQVLMESTVDAEIDGTTDQFRVCLTDISIQKKQQEQLHRNQEEWERTFNALPDIVTLQDKNMRILRANRAAHEVFSLENGALEGKYCYDIFCGFTEPCRGCPIHKVSVDNVHCTETIKNERLNKIFQISSSPVLDHNDEVQFMVHIAQDITDQKQLEMQLRQKYKMEAVGVMAGGMAHNFNNNLSIILGNVELTNMKMPPNEEIAGYLGNAKIAIMRSRDLVQQILTYARRGMTGQVSVRLPLIIDETIQLLKLTFPTTLNLQQKISSNSLHLTINADPSQIQECLINLCNNAMYAMDEVGTLTISLEATELQQNDIPVQYKCTPGPYARLSVEDDGQGIPAQNLEKIFDLFYTTKPVDKGTGVGLSTVQGIVTQNKGLVKVESTVGKGTRFDLYFPLTKHAQVNEVQTLNENQPEGTERILFVDDNEMLATLGQKLLQEKGYQVTMMTDSVAALKLFATNPDNFQLVITDQTMPRLAGKELIRELKIIRSDIPTIICTGYSSKIDEETAKDLGANAFLMKPLDLPALLQTIRRILDGKKE